MAIKMNVTALPSGTFFSVLNGGYTDYIEKDEKTGNNIIYCGVDMLNPTENYVNKTVIPCGYSWEQTIDIISKNNKQHNIVLSDFEIDIFLSYIENNDMPTAFKNTDWIQIFNKITDYKKTDKISNWIERDE